MTSTSTRSMQDAFAAALDDVSTRGVTAQINVMTCCRSCAVSGELAELSNFVWTFGGQGRELVWDSLGYPLLREQWQRECQCDGEELDENGAIVLEAYTCELCEGVSDEVEERLTAADRLYFYFDSVTAADVLRNALEEQGFRVEWDGSEAQAVAVLF